MVFILAFEVCEGDNFSGFDTGAYDSRKEKGKTPFSTAIIVSLILRVAAEDPSITNKTLQYFLEPYGKKFVLT
jgi:hypothetical protein